MTAERTEGIKREAPQAVAARRLRWLQAQLAQWERDGLVTGTAAATIRGRYVTKARANLLAVVTGLGVAFLAIGLIWLVAANLDELGPLVRLAAVAAVWIGLALAAEVLTLHRLASVCRTLSAAAFGAVIFQAAQSLQVPAYESVLVGCWGLGALLYAYASGSRGAFTVALGVSTLWFGWHTSATARSVPQGAVTLLCAGILATALAVAHRGRLGSARPGFARGWQIAGEVFALVGLFVAAVPFGQPDHPLWQPALGATLAVTAVAVTVALVIARLHPGGSLTADSRTGTALPRGWASSGVELVVLLWVLALGAGLVRWQPATATGVFEATAMTPELWFRTGASILLFLCVAAWFAVLGAWRESPELTSIALVALVGFTTFQSFAVFAPIISGATLFLAVGAVMLVAGLAADRLRRLLTRPKRGGPGDSGRSASSGRGGRRRGLRHVARSGDEREASA